MIEIRIVYLIAFSVSLPYFVLLSSGVMSAWVYLRFYQRHSRGRGDLADHFSFASFFPRVFRVSEPSIWVRNPLDQGLIILF